ncbi:hypothetical protein RHMOL_Rhmol09G0121200 [Rhododendron molle]|uniref:Uncharacterized protein n=1 Tax=Rhododendron molle TaxID=49168 RepID=A0ACC0MD18_RHOML|nr:hypothetical protein RHMOL_Rhmol09G0121200 [Rhododendron molle]
MRPTVKTIFTVLEDVKAVLKEFNQKVLGEIPESLQTTEVRDKIFHKVLGKDGHGYCKTYGAGVPRSAVYGQSSRLSHASSSSTPSSLMFNEELMAHLECIGVLDAATFCFLVDLRIGVLDAATFCFLVDLRMLQE